MSFFKRLWQTLFGETKSAPEQLSDEDLQRERIKLKTKRDELETEITKLADTENQLKEEFKLALQQKNATAQRSIANKLQELEKDRKIAENRLVKVNKEYRATTTIQVIKEEEGSRSPFGANQQDWEKYLIGKTVEEQMRQETLDTIERYGDEVINAMGGDEQEMTTNDYMAKLAAELGEELTPQEKVKADLDLDEVRKTIDDVAKQGVGAAQRQQQTMNPIETREEQ